MATPVSQSQATIDYNQQASLWLKQLIMFTWDFSLSLWRFRNTHIHGIMKLEQAAMKKCSLQGQIIAAYSAFLINPSLVSWSQSYLFKQSSIEEKWKGTHDQMICWLDISIAVKLKLETM